MLPEILSAVSAPFGFVTEASMEQTVAKLNTSYGEMPPTGHGPDPQRIESPEGDAYLKKEFPDLDYFVSCARF